MFCRPYFCLSFVLRLLIAYCGIFLVLRLLITYCGIFLVLRLLITYCGIFLVLRLLITYCGIFLVLRLLITYCGIFLVLRLLITYCGIFLVLRLLITHCGIFLVLAIVFSLLRFTSSDYPLWYLLSFGHCVFSPSFYVFWLPIVVSSLFWPLCFLSFVLRLLITYCGIFLVLAIVFSLLRFTSSDYPLWYLLSFGHCVFSPSFYGFWLPIVVSS